MESLLVFLGIAALIWGIVLLLRGGLMAGCLATLLAGCCFGHPFLHFNIGPLPVTLDRILTGVMAVVYVVYRCKGWADPKTVSKSDILFGVVLAVLTLSTLAHDFQLHNFQPATRLVFLWIMPAVLYWVLRQSPLQERPVVALMGFLSLLGIYLAVTALAETRGMWELVFPKYIGDPKFVEFYGRGRGPFLNPVANGIYLVTGAIATLMMWPRISRRQRVPLLAVFCLIAMGAYCTYTRSVWMSFALCTVIVVGVSIPRSWRVPVIGIASLSCLLFVAMNFEQFIAFKRDKNLTAAETADSVKLRPIFAAVAWRMFQDHPLVGCGFGQYSDAIVDYLGDRSTPLMLERARTYVQHNVVLAIVCETGLAGVVPFLLLLGLWLRDGWRLWRNATLPLYARQFGLLMVTQVTVYFFNGMFHDVAIVPMDNMLLFFVAGVGSGLAAQFNARPVVAVAAPSPYARRTPSLASHAG